MEHADREKLVASFADITGVNPSAASFHLEASQWILEDAIQLHFASMTDAPPPLSPPPLQPSPSTQPLPSQESKDPIPQDDDVPPPLPIKTEALYEEGQIFRINVDPTTVPSVSANDAFRNFREEAKRFHANFDSNEFESRNTLASLYRPPFDIMFTGNFEQAKAEGCNQKKWLIINIQCTTEFLSYTLNRDLWAHEMVKEMIKNNFIFWQAYEDTKEGRKVCGYYNITTFPYIFIMDPLTGQKVKFWQNKVHSDKLLEDLLLYMEKGPFEKRSHPTPSVNTVVDDEESELQQAIALSQSQGSQQNLEVDPASNPTVQIPSEPQSPQVSQECNIQQSFKTFPLPDQPEPSNSNSCKIALRLPNGQRIQHRFLKSDPIKYLTILCCQADELAGNGKKFRLLPALPGHAALDLFSDTSFEEMGLMNTMISMLWD